jgi:enoyl-CoA hydratase
MEADEQSIIDVVKGEGIEIWRMNFAPVNALDPRLLSALMTRLDEAVADPTISVIVLTSGLRIFSAGADAGWMSEIVKTKGLNALLEDFNATMDIFRELCLRIRRSALLMIAAMNGHTLAGGLELAAACDLRFSSNSERMQIGVPEMDLFGAIPTGGGGAQYLSRLLGSSQALQFILDAKPVSPQVALGMKLVDRLYDPTQLIEQTESFALSVAKKAGRIGVNAAKRAILGGAELPLYEALEFDRSLHWDAMRRGNFLRGVDEFIRRYGSK